MKFQSAILAGTGHTNEDGSDRAYTIQRFCSAGTHVDLVREPDNEYDENAIAVYVKAPDPLVLKSHVDTMIGYIKAGTAKSLAKKIDRGDKVDAFIKSLWAPEDVEFPRVTLNIYLY